MPSMIKKSFNAPEEIRHFDKGKVEVVRLGEVEVIRVTNQPGWRWSEWTTVPRRSSVRATSDSSRQVMMRGLLGTILL